MFRYRGAALGSAAAAILACLVPLLASAQVSIRLGPAPACPYGYFDYAPYACAPYGYYGPGWFSDGVFIGAGPWFHGPRSFQGRVDTHFDPQRGYRGPLPHTHTPRSPNINVSRMGGFRGDEVRDGRGHGRPG